MGDRIVFDRLKHLLNQSPSRTITKDDKIVIFSDLHVGNGKRKDDFLHNAGLCLAALSRYYLPREFTLVLNGDIEDMQKFPHFVIRRCNDPRNLRKSVT